MKNTVRFVNSIHKIGVAAWQQLSNTDNPFLRFEFLAALEDSHCIDSVIVGKALGSGWIPNYALLEDPGLENEEPQTLAIAPIFQKLHSSGEYVFDWGWAEAYERHGLNYYPKLVWAIPFTPSAGPRIISQGNSEQLAQYHQQLAQGLTRYCLNSHFSGWHCLFPDTLGNESLAHKSINNDGASNKVMPRTSCQFHWFNDGGPNNGTSKCFNDFSHYLEKFTSRKRKNIKKERSRLIESGFIFNRKVANQITPEDIENFYHCYQLTYAKRNMRGYLSLQFFQQILQTMPDQLLLVQAQQPLNNQDEHQDSNRNSDRNRTVANALYFKDNDNLYGRYWGCLEEFDSLHFECCYYQGIEYCIEHNISHFDPGTQGEHKISRGFEPTLCHSQHWIAHPQFSEAIDNFLKEERPAVQDYAARAVEHLPFNHDALKSSLSPLIPQKYTK
jgi:predicted N-acyltransferase